MSNLYTITQVRQKDCRHRIETQAACTLQIALAQQLMSYKDLHTHNYPRLQRQARPRPESEGGISNDDNRQQEFGPSLPSCSEFRPSTVRHIADLQQPVVAQPEDATQVLQQHNIHNYKGTFSPSHCFSRIVWFSPCHTNSYNVQLLTRCIAST